jgi:hypothetical protein
LCNIYGQPDVPQRDFAGLATFLQQPERDFYLSPHRHRASALHARPESPFHYSLNGFLIEPEPEGAGNFNIARQAVGIYYNRKQNAARVLRELSATVRKLSYCVIQ